MIVVSVTFEGGSKKYAFLDTESLTCKLDLGVGSIIIDKRYSNKMTIASISNNPNVIKGLNGYSLGGIILKDFQVDEILVRKENTSERFVSISISKAREWYKSGDSALKSLALSVYTENELLDIPESVEEVCKKLNIGWNTSWKGFSGTEIKSFERQMATTAVARYLNKGWEKSSNEEGFFLGYVGAYSTAKIIARVEGSSLAVLSHFTIKYPGIVYFKTPELVAKAYKLLKRYF